MTTKMHEPINYGTQRICTDWKAEWIWKDEEVQVNDFAYFRKEFSLEGTASIATVYVSAHNHFELFINGIRVSGYVTPAPTHPEKSKYYLCYDVANLLKNGLNTFCASVHYIGGGGQNYVNGLPGFIMQCNISIANGKEVIFITDETWKSQGNTPFRNGTEFQQDRKVSAIEDYDSRKEENGWLQHGFDDSHWKSACISRIDSETWVLKPQTIPEGKVYEVIVPSPVGIQEKGLQVFDAGKIVSGWPRIELDGVEGVQVRMRYSEDIDEAGRVRHNVTNEKSEYYYDQYTMKGAGKEVWEPSFSYKAFRYVEVTGYPEIVKPENIKVVSAGTGLTYSGYFNSSNKLLNDIYNACIQTQKNNVLGQMVDCPHREQAQYLADSDLQAETFSYNFKDPEVLKKVLLDFKDAQFDYGSFPFVFPTNFEIPRYHTRIPEWDIHYISLLWKVYFMYDDIDILHTCYGTAKKVLDYYLGIRNKITGLVPKADSYSKVWHISDWPYPDIDESGEYLTVQNCKLYNAAGLLSRMALILGLNEDVAEIDLYADALKESIVKHLYRPDIKRFVDSSGSNQTHQGTNVVAYRYGLIPEDDREAVLEYIVQENFGCSTLLTLDLLKLLFENGKGREALKLIDSTKQPGWGYMIAKGYKTIWEGFSDIESHSHAWNAYPARILVEYLVGIKAASPGFKIIDIKPYIASEMQYAEGKIYTVHGDVYARWDKNNKEIKLTINIPVGASARVFLPWSADKTSSIKESGELIWQAGAFYNNSRNICYGGEDERYIMFETGSGRYVFVVQ